MTKLITVFCKFFIFIQCFFKLIYIYNYALFSVVIFFNEKVTLSILEGFLGELVFFIIFQILEIFSSGQYFTLFIRLHFISDDG